MLQLQLVHRKGELYGLSHGSEEPAYQVVYVGESGLPEFVQIRADSDADAERQAREFITKNKDELRKRNAFVYLYKTVQRLQVVQEGD